MSRFVFKMPDLGEGTVTAEVVEWKVKVGDSVEEDQIIAEVMTDKAAVEIPSPVTGRVVSITGQPGEMVAVGSELIAFDTSGAAPARPRPRRRNRPPVRPRRRPPLPNLPPPRSGRARRGDAGDGLACDPPQSARRRGGSRDGERFRPGRPHFGAGHRVRDRGQGRRRAPGRRPSWRARASRKSRSSASGA